MAASRWKRRRSSAISILRNFGHLAASAVINYLPHETGALDPDTSAALELASAARELSHAVDGRDFESLALLCVGLAELACGRPERAALAFPLVFPDTTIKSRATPKLATIPTPVISGWAHLRKTRGLVTESASNPNISPVGTVLMVQRRCTNEGNR